MREGEVYGYAFPHPSTFNRDDTNQRLQLIKARGQGGSERTLTDVIDSEKKSQAIRFRDMRADYAQRLARFEIVQDFFGFLITVRTEWNIPKVGGL